MKLTILGSGTCVPSVKRASPSMFLQVGALRALLDIGAGSLRQLAHVGAQAYQNIDLVYISHHHTDHIADLSPLIQALNWTPGFIRKKELLVAGHSRLGPMLRSVLREAVHFKARFVPILSTVRIKGVVFNVFPGKHAPTSLVVKITEGNKSLVYTADTEYNSALERFAHGCDLFITENSYPGTQKAAGHLNASESGKLAALVHAKKLLLTHIYPPADKVDLRKQVSRYYKGPIIIAKDLMTFSI